MMSMTIEQVSSMTIAQVSLIWKVFQHFQILYVSLEAFKGRSAAVGKQSPMIKMGIFLWMKKNMRIP